MINLEDIYENETIVLETGELIYNCGIVMELADYTLDFFIKDRR